MHYYRVSTPPSWNPGTTGGALQQAGPLAEREQRLVKLALALGAGLESAAHSHTRRAVAKEITPDDLRYVSLLGLTTLGFPTMMRGMSGIEDILTPDQR
jgi:4-carboxymuconolactone decarboxylase